MRSFFVFLKTPKPRRSRVKILWVLIASLSNTSKPATPFRINKNKCIPRVITALMVHQWPINPSGDVLYVSEVKINKGTLVLKKTKVPSFDEY